MVLAAIPEKKAMEKEAPVVAESLPNLIRGRARAATLLVQFSASIKLAMSRPMERKQSRRMRGQIRLGQSCGRISAACIDGAGAVMDQRLEKNADPAQVAAILTLPQGEGLPGSA